jgi:hypothetical protein
LGGNLSVFGISEYAGSIDHECEHWPTDPVKLIQLASG